MIILQYNYKEFYVKTESLSDNSLAYYSERACGGFVLITFEATVVDKKAKGGPRKPCLFEDSTIESFKRVIDA